MLRRCASVLFMCSFACSPMWLLVGCASAPVSPLQSAHQPEAEDEAALWYQMGEFEKELRQSPAVERDPALTQYVQLLVCRLADDLCGDVRVYLVRSPYFNAFMTPNGVMVLFTGLLLRSENEAQLGFVIAHELAHYRQRHGLENWRSKKSTGNLLAAIGMLAGAGNAGGVAALVSNLGAYAYLADYSRNQEREADQLGAQRMRVLGYQLKPAVSLWQAALEEEKANPRGFMSAIFASHPATEERIENLRAEAAQPSVPASMQPDDAAFGAIVIPRRKQWLDEELSRRNYAQTEVLLRRMAGFGTGRGAVAFSRGELRRMRNQGADLVAATASYREALQYPDAPVETYRQLGLVLRRQGQPDAAKAAFRSYLKRAPQANDRALIESYL